MTSHEPDGPKAVKPTFHGERASTEVSLAYHLGAAVALYRATAIFADVEELRSALRSAADTIEKTAELKVLAHRGEKSWDSFIPSDGYLSTLDSIKRWGLKNLVLGILLGVFHLWDPEGLLRKADSGGAYVRESEAVYQTFWNFMSEEDLVERIADAFSRGFHRKYSLAECRLATRAVWVQVKPIREYWVLHPEELIIE